jgi:hypothetical protein
MKKIKDIMQDMKIILKNLRSYKIDIVGSSLSPEAIADIAYQDSQTILSEVVTILKADQSELVRMRPSAKTNDHVMIGIMREIDTRYRSIIRSILTYIELPEHERLAISICRIYLDPDRCELIHSRETRIGF